MATSTRPLAAEVESGEFRSELFYRLQVLTISLPPLRERIDDLERLVAAHLPAEIRLSPTALLALQEHSWPGNARELENVLWRASLLAKGGVVELRHLALTAGLAPLGTEDEAGRSGRQTPIKLAEVERRTILAALERTGGNKLRAASLLGIARSTLHDKLRRL
jgi:DNA-binding NtrC family response regulator